MFEGLLTLVFLNYFVSLFVWSRVSVHHVLRETCHVLIAWLVQLLLDLALHRLNHVISPVVRVSTIAPTHDSARLVIVYHLLDTE